MHQLSAVGVGKTIDFDDPGKTIRMAFKVVDDNAWKKVTEGVYTGFSQGGKYVKIWKGADHLKHYTASPTEISLVDNPCLKTATFEYVKADGATEMRKFAQEPEEQQLQLSLSDEDVDRIADRIAAKTAAPAAKTTSPAAESSKLKQFLEKNNVTAKDMADRVTALIEFLGAQNMGKSMSDLMKSMYDVKDMAGVFQTLSIIQGYLRDERVWEGDDSPIPEQITQVLIDLQTVFLALVKEETDELLALAAQTETEKAMKTITLDDLKKAATGIGVHLTKAKQISAIVKAAAKKMNDDVEKAMDVMDDCMDKSANLLASQGDISLTDIIPAGTGTAAEAMNTSKAAVPGPLTKADLEEMLKAHGEKVQETTLDAVAEVMKATFETEETAATGIGDRSQLAKSASVSQTVTENKATVKITGQTSKTDITDDDVRKAATGDQEAALKLARAAVSGHASNVPMGVLNRLPHR